MTVVAFPERASSGALIDRRELARRLRLSERWIAYQIRDHGLPVVRLGGAVRFRWCEVEAWMQRRSA